MTTSYRRLSILPAAILFFYHVLSNASISLAGRVSVQYKIKPRQTECIYDHFHERDVVTFSVFVVKALQNGKPKASVAFEGPVAGNTDLVPQHLQRDENTIEGEDLEPAGPRSGRKTIGRDIRQGMLNEWAKINVKYPPNGAKRRKFNVDWTHAGESEDARAARADILKESHEEFRKYRLENMDNEDEHAPPPPLHTVAKEHIDPHEETDEITAKGWYRLCVTAMDRVPLEVEMDMRTAEKMRGINPGTGHAYTYEAREYLDEQEQYFGKPMGDGGVMQIDVKGGDRVAKDEDFEESKTKLQYMHELTSEIMKSQHQRMQRIRTHDTDARRASAELARSSQLETLLFVIITGAQVYTVHKWLLGNQLLGK